MMTHVMSCETFDRQLADYLDDDLDVNRRRMADAHLASCLRCSALVRDLDQIRDGARGLAELAPSRDLWDGIARRIEAPVIPFTAPAAPMIAPGAVPLASSTRRRSLDRLRTAAIAAALVAVTAGVTYTLTMSRVQARAGGPMVAQVGEPRDGTRRDTTTAATATSAADATSSATQTPRTELADAGDSAAPPVAASAPSVRSSARAVGNTPVATTYSREIDRLRTIFARNRGQLDPRTAAIIEANLKVIDDAIAQSRAALAQDPASRFLTDQLNSALEKKVELLRTAALLPQRT